MPHDDRLMPIRPRTHSTGDMGVTAFQYYVSTLKWTFESIGKDYGLDGKIEVFKDGRAAGYMFFMQSKSTEKSLSDKKYVVEYFEAKKRNYFLRINAPVMIALYSMPDKMTYFKWVFSEDDFDYTSEGYKFVFNRKDFISLDYTDMLQRSVEIAQELYNFTINRKLKINISAKPSDLVSMQSYVRNDLKNFNINIDISEESPILLSVENGNTKLELPGFLHLEEKYDSALSGFLRAVELIFEKLHIDYKNVFKILNLVNTMGAIEESDISHLPQFVEDIKWSEILASQIDRLSRSGDTNLPKIISYLQLNFFSLDDHSRELLVDVRRSVYNTSPSPENSQYLTG